MSHDLKVQVTANKELSQKAAQFEQKSIEMHKKYEDVKKSYFAVKETRDKLKTELDKIKEHKTETNGQMQPDLAQKYEILKKRC